ncbi:hypothetical protein EJD97_016001 [Solanum chilense]|uniref:Chromo domain-containing protein n=1 Tax=Solanum chilense TaxID=4083 RepID=A0A6N2CEM6_SOLCI|nr:hypothetical protein EJD97_016001 [Solanum chilense]
MDQLASVHPVFKISSESVIVKDNITYEEISVEILDLQAWRLRNKEVTSVKILWRSQSVERATWKEEAIMMAKYPHIFPFDSVSA